MFNRLFYVLLCSLFEYEESETGLQNSGLQEVKPLTASEVKSAKPEERDYTMHDGFGLLRHVSKAGGKSWRFVTCTHSPESVKLTSSVTIQNSLYLKPESPEINLRRLLARGIDPAAYRRENR